MFALKLDPRFLVERLSNPGAPFQGCAVAGYLPAQSDQVRSPTTQDCLVTMEMHDSPAFVS